MFLGNQKRHANSMPCSKCCQVYAYARLKLRHQLLLDVLKKRMIEAAKICSDVVLVPASTTFVQRLPAAFCHSLSKGCKSNAALAFGVGGQRLCPVADQRFG